MGCANSLSARVAKPQASRKKVLVVRDGDTPPLTTALEAQQHEHVANDYDEPKRTFTYFVNPYGDGTIADGCYDIPTGTSAHLVNPGGDDVPLSGVYHMSAEVGVEPMGTPRKFLVVRDGDTPPLRTALEAQQHEHVANGYDEPKSTFTYFVNPHGDGTIADGCYDIPRSTFTYFVNPGGDDVPLSGVYHMSAEAGVDTHTDELASNYTVGSYASPLGATVKRHNDDLPKPTEGDNTLPRCSRTDARIGSYALPASTPCKWHRDEFTNSTAGGYALPRSSDNDAIGGYALPVSAAAKCHKDELPKPSEREYALPKGSFVDASAYETAKPSGRNGTLPSLYLSARAASAYATPANAYAGYAPQVGQANDQTEQHVGAFVPQASLGRHASYKITNSDVERDVGYSAGAAGVYPFAEQKGSMNSRAYLLRQGSLAHTISPAFGDGVPLFSCDLE